MLTFELCDSEGTEFFYRYFRGDTSDSGLVAIDVETCESRIVELAPGDEHKWYVFHMMRTLEAMARNNDYRDHGTVIWH